MRLRLLMVGTVGVALAACGSGHHANDTAQVNALRVDPIFHIAVPGGHPGQIETSGAGGGPQSGPVLGMRNWRLDAISPDVVAAVLTAERDAGVDFNGVSCPPNGVYGATGSKWSISTAVTVSFTPRPPALVISSSARSAAASGQAPNSTGSAPPSTLAQTLDGRCPAIVVDAVRRG